MKNIILTLRNLDRLPDRPVALQGISGKLYGHALYDRSQGGHIFKMSLEEWLENHVDIIRGMTRPLSMWAIIGIEVDGDALAETQLAEELDKLQAEIAELTFKLTEAEAARDKAFAERDEFARQRDAAIRAIQTGGERQPVERVEAPVQAPSDGEPVIDQSQPQAAELADNGTLTGGAQAPETVEESTEDASQVPQNQQNEVANATSLEGPVTEEPTGSAAYRAEISAISKFRDLRSRAKKDGVPDYDAHTEKQPLIEAMVAHHEATAARTDG